MRRLYLFVPFLCIFFLPVLFDLEVHSELQSSKDQVCPHIKQVFLGVENTKCMVNHRKAVMRTLLTYTITWVVCDLRSWCLTAGVLFVTFDVVSGRYRDTRMGRSFNPDFCGGWNMLRDDGIPKLFFDMFSRTQHRVGE